MPDRVMYVCQDKYAGRGMSDEQYPDEQYRHEQYPNEQYPDEQCHRVIYGSRIKNHQLRDTRGYIPDTKSFQDPMVSAGRLLSHARAEPVSCSCRYCIAVFRVPPWHCTAVR